MIMRIKIASKSMGIGEPTRVKITHGVWSKAIIMAALSLVGAASIPSSFAGQECYSCPYGKLIDATYDCPDPAFLAVDLKPRLTLPVRRVKEAKLFEEKDAASLNASEMAAWQDFEQRVQKNPETAYQAAMEIWSSNYGDSFQRMAIYRARALVRSTDEIENLAFLLACLEDSKTQKENCLSLGKGNGLERKLAARRLALLTSNPKLAK